MSGRQLGMQVDEQEDLCWLDRVQPDDRLEIGDKAYNLGLLMQYGCPVIPGFVVMHRVFRRFLSEIAWLEPLFSDLPDSSLYVDVNNPHQLQAIARQIRQAIVTTPLSSDWLATVEAQAQGWNTPMLILRPSLALLPDLDPAMTNSTRGLLSPQLCCVERGAIADGLRRVWAELFRAKSLFYWQRSRLQLHQLRLGVLVQPIESAIAAGDAHIHASELEIRSVCGLGMALTWGEVTPDIEQIHPVSGALQNYATGIKTHTYRLTVPPEAEPEKEVQNSPALCLTADLLDSAAQHHPALTDSQRQQVADLVRLAHAAIGDELELEWTIPIHPTSAVSDLTTTAYITQLNRHRRLVTVTDGIASTSQAEFAAALSTRATAPPQTEAHLLARSIDGSPLSLGNSVSDTGSSLAASDSSNGLSNGLSNPLVSASSAIAATPPSAVPDLVLTGIAAAPGTAFGRVLVLRDGDSPPTSIPAGTVLLVLQVTPNWLPQLRQASGIVAEQGGMTSHGAILARELGIPAIVGVSKATQLLQTGDIVSLDGDRGFVYRLVANTPLPERWHPVIERPSVQPWDRPTATQLMLNLSQLEAIANVSQLPVDGVGLLRAEHLLMERSPIQPGSDAPAEWSDPAALTQPLISRLQPFVDAFAPRPVFYRSLDARSHEWSGLLFDRHLLPESNPPVLNPPAPNSLLGCHGTFSYCLDPTYFDAELAALRQLQQAGYTNLHLILPFVRTVEEFQFCQQRVVDAGLTQVPNFQLWIMAEVPSVLFLLPDFVQAGVQGIALGSNDLTQLLLAIDRDHPQMAAYTAVHPAVMRAMRQLVETARQLGIPCCICGEAPAIYPELIDDLVRWGITSISVSPAAALQTHRAIAQAEQRLLLEAARRSLES